MTRKERSFPPRHPRRTEGTCRSITRSSPFAGRVTETALRRKAKLGVEREELWPTATRMTCSDVHYECGAATEGAGETASRGKAFTSA